MRRPISPEQPMWLIHIDTWNYPDPKKIIELIPEDIRPFVVMNISLSISHDVATSRFQVAEYGYEIAKSWVRTCAENQMWAMVQLSSGGYAQFSDFDLSVYEEFYKDYPNFIGFNYAEQFWGYDDPNDPLSAKWTDRMSHFANLLKLSNQYGGYLTVSMCWNQWGPSINPIGMMKRHPKFAAACEQYTENYILCEKYTQEAYQSDMESICLGAYLSGYSGNYGLRYDDTGWTDANGKHENFTMATAGAVVLEHMMLTGETVLDGPELIWTQCFRETNRISTTDGYSARNWETFPQFDNVSVDLFRKVLDGTVRIPTRQEVIERTKFVIINDVNTGNDDDKYSTPSTLFQGLYRMDGDGNLKDNKTFFKKTGRYPTIPVVYNLDDSLANTFEYQINKSGYSGRWPSVTAKQTELNSVFPKEYSGDLYAGRNENGWVVYNPYKTNQVANGSIPFKYNTCDSMQLSFSQYTAGVVKEYSDKLTFYLSNYDNVIDTKLKTDIIKIYGSSQQPTYTYTDRANHKASEVTSSWLNGVLTLTVKHNGPIDISVDCAGTATNRLTAFKTATLVAPKKPSVYTGALQYEAEFFDYKNISGITTGGYSGDVRNYSGQGYLKFGTGASASVRDTVSVLESDNYQLSIKYAVVGSNVNTIDLYVNGSRVSTPVFTKTVSTSQWEVNHQSIWLNAGKNVIELKANGTGSASIIFDNMIIGPESDYTFTNDAASTSATTPPAKYMALQSGSAGVISFTDANNVTSNCFTAYSAGSTNGTGVADLERIPVAGNYTILWKEYYGTTEGTKGMLLRANGESGSCAYAEGMKQGYLFTVTNNTDKTVTLKAFLANSSGIEEKASFTSAFTVDAGQPCWHRATATNTEFMFECSIDSIHWEGSTATTFSDSSYSSGSTELIWGLNSNNFSWAMDNITYLITSISVSDKTLSGMTYMLDAGPSSSQAVKVSGRSLIGGIELAVSDNFEIAISPDSSFAPALSIDFDDASVDTTIYVRLKPGFEAGVYSGELVLISKGAATETVKLNGAVITDWVYNFSNDVATNSASTPPALNITMAAGNGATAGVASYKYKDGTSNCFRAYSGGERNITGIADLGLFPTDSANYTVTWKQAIGSGGKDYKVGVVLRGSKLAEGAAGYVNGIMQGYVFIVYTAGGASNPHSEFRIYKSSEATNLNVLVNNTVSTLLPSAGQPVWYRASANGTESTELTFEYSADNSNWFTAATYTDATTTYQSGATQLIWGLAAGNWDFYLDDISCNPYKIIPSIAVTTNSLTGFSYIKGHGPSEAQSFSISRKHMDQDIAVTASDKFEVSVKSDSDFSSSLVLSGSGEQIVYVRLKEALSTGLYNGEIVITSAGFDDKVISLKGSVKTNTDVPLIQASTATVVSKEYYTTTGQKIRNTENMRGIFIEKCTMSDHTVKVSKIFMK